MNGKHAQRKAMMTKLALDLEAVDVVSFEPVGAAAAEEAMTVPPYCLTFTCGDSRIRACLEG